MVESDVIDIDASTYTLVKNSPIISFITDLNGKFMVGNIKGSNFYRSGFDKIQSNETLYFKIEDIQSELNNLDNKLLSKENFLECQRYFLSDDGEEYLYKISKIPIRTSGGKINAIATFVCNIDAEVRIVKERETYISTLTHDIKTPVLAQIRALELILKEYFGKLTHEQRDILNIMLDSCNYTYEMLTYTLMNYREFNTPATIHSTTIEINKLVKECVQYVQNKISKNNISFCINSSENKIYLQADNAQLKSVIINFLSTSLRSAYENSDIIIELNKRENLFDLQISCFGPYIEQEKIDKIFNKNSTCKEKFDRIGFGLGLYSIKKIIEAHGGCIFVKSNCDNHNLIGFTLPLNKSN